MSSLKEFNRFTSGLREDGMLMPVIFVGHGSPMNGILHNEFSQYWKELAATLPVPKAVLVISAHWLSRGTRITAMEFPKTIHDFGGFPQELFDVQYPAPGDPLLAKETAAMVAPGIIEQDHDWGLDHGTWTIVRHMYPEANIPVLQLSIDYTKPPQYHYQLASELMALRKKGVLILGSGNMVHNLRMVAWDKLNETEYGFDWAVEMNGRFKELISSGDDKSLIAFDKLGSNGLLSIPTPEHYLPLVYTLGLRNANEPLSFFNDKLVGGSLSMTSVRFS
jgi:4,5-DOPA dioxygenase extradiol